MEQLKAMMSALPRTTAEMEAGCQELETNIASYSEEREQARDEFERNVGDVQRAVEDLAETIRTECQSLRNTVDECSENLDRALERTQRIYNFLLSD